MNPDMLRLIIPMIDDHLVRYSCNWGRVEHLDTAEPIGIAQKQWWGGADDYQRGKWPILRGCLGWGSEFPKPPEASIVAHVCVCVYYTPISSVARGVPYLRLHAGNFWLSSTQLTILRGVPMGQKK